MSATAIISANLGGFDEVWPQAAQSQDCDFFYVCDREVTVPDPWKLLVTAPGSEDPRLAAKVYKCTPWVVLKDYRNIIWIDASIEITASWFVRNALKSRHDGLAAFAHPRRNCVYAEAHASVTTEAQDGKYDATQIREQVDWYRTIGHPSNSGLWALGILSFDTQAPKVREFGERWLTEIIRFSVQDQLSFPVIARQMGIEPGTFPVPQITGRSDGYLYNPWLKLHDHLR